MAIYHVKRENVEVLEPLIAPRLKTARFITALTGAGISKASGIPLISEKIQGVELREFFDADFFIRRPNQYYEIYRHTLTKWRTARPNPAHFAIAKRDIWVVTQNIDGLHRDAGTKRLIELHGNLRELYCAYCQTIFGSELAFEEQVPHCHRCHHILQPGISLEGQEIRHYSRAVDWFGRAEVVFIVGTQLEMHPVCDLPKIVEAEGAEVVWVNEAAEVIVPRLLDCLRPTWHRET